MTFSDIWNGSQDRRKANYFIVIDNILSLFIIGFHGPFTGFKSRLRHHNKIKHLPKSPFSEGLFFGPINRFSSKGLIHSARNGVDRNHFFARPWHLSLNNRLLWLFHPLYQNVLMPCSQFTLS
jgi:hypothetical protein